MKEYFSDLDFGAPAGKAGHISFQSSLPCEAEQFAKAVRAHWGIENPLHYVLAAAFGEDECRIRKDKGPENAD
jgi:predicted transposase YbfD/YdcC